MSRIGKMPIAVPKGVQITVTGEAVTIKGPKGQLQVDLLPGVTAALEEGQLSVRRADESAPTRSYHGLIRSLIANAAVGVSEGWSKELEIVGIGYRAESKGASVLFNLGYSHPIDFAVPAGIQIEVEPKTNKVKVTGFDRQQVGQVAADIRALRPPEPYKGKGIRYANERIRIKAGKQGASA
jgi:large subunit ribosomal protein L6